MRACRDWLAAASLAEIRDRDCDAGVPPRVTVLPPRCGHDPADCPPIPDRQPAAEHVTKIAVNGWTVADAWPPPSAARTATTN